MSEQVVIDKIKFDGVIYDSLELTKMMFDKDFTKHHLNLIFTLLSLYNDNNNAMSYKIQLKELFRAYEPKTYWRKGIDKATKKTAEELMKLHFIVPNKEKGTLKYHHWVDTVEIPENPTENDYAEIVLHKDVTKFFSQLKKQNLVYSLKYILELSTLTEARLYRWAYAKKGFKNDVPIAIDDAKMTFCGRTNINTPDFMRYNLTSAINHINEKTDLHIEFEPVRADPRVRTKVTSLRFKIRCNYEPKSNRTESQKKSDRERSKKMWQVVKEQEEIIELQDQIIQDQQDAILKITNENLLVQENEHLKTENTKLKIEKALCI